MSANRALDDANAAAQCAYETIEWLQTLAAKVEARGDNRLLDAIVEAMVGVWQVMRVQQICAQTLWCQTRGVGKVNAGRRLCKRERDGSSPKV